MNLLILGLNAKAEGSPCYRGTDRRWPTHFDTLPDNHPANVAFFWFCQDGGGGGIVHNLNKARDLVRLYNDAQCETSFEVIEVAQNCDSSQSGGNHLGFDLSYGFCQSLLRDGLEFSKIPEPESMSYLEPLIRLIETYFKPLLNHNGLFSNYTTAKHCLECMMLLQRFHPGLWENRDAEFEVVSIFLAPEDSSEESGSHLNIR